MRLNLGEIALCLGCKPGNVLWDGPAIGDTSAKENAAPPTLKALAQKRGTPGGAEPRAHDWSGAPWASLTCMGAQIDSRKVQPGNLFFCLPGEQVDGHDFALAAAKAGASAIVAARNPFLDDAGGNLEEGIVLPPVFLVDDVRHSLWRLAMCHRDTSLARVVGITGTAGKTSVKEVLAQVLSMRGRTERNPMNLNNQIGLPLSMLNASADASFWVLEMGISEPQDMDELGAILRPDVGLILNVGDGHVAGLGDLGVANYKARMIDYIQPSGYVAISHDYPELDNQVEAHAAIIKQRNLNVIRFTTGQEKNAFRAEYLGATPSGRGKYSIHINNRTMTVEAPFRGGYGSENVIAIVTIALIMGLSEEEIRSGLVGARLPDQRFNCVHYPNFSILDDCYNANPLSSTRMIQAAKEMADEMELPLVLVMGEMLELGEKAEEAHVNLGTVMAKAKPELVLWKGGNTDAVKEGLAKAGYEKDFFPVGGPHDFSLLLEEFSLQKALLLFKGSRSNHLEELVSLFHEKAAPKGGSDAL